MNEKVKFAQALLTVAKSLTAEETGDDFTEKIRNVRQNMTKLSAMKSQRLGTLGVAGVGRNSTIEDLVNLLDAIFKNSAA